jgi:hypothetical protein
MKRRWILNRWSWALPVLPKNKIHERTIDMENQMTSLTHLPKTGAARATTNREPCHKMRSQDHLNRYFDRLETPILAYKRIAIN